MRAVLTGEFESVNAFLVGSLDTRDIPTDITLPEPRQLDFLQGCFIFCPLIDFAVEADHIRIES
jgi:hypothetical protein